MFRHPATGNRTNITYDSPVVTDGPIIQKVTNRTTAKTSLTAGFNKIFETNSRLLLIAPTTFLIGRSGTGITKYPTHA